MTPEETISYLLITDLFAIDEQREAVKQPVDGEPRLVNGQNDGAAVVRHPEEIDKTFSHGFCPLSENKCTFSSKNKKPNKTNKLDPPPPPQNN